MKECFQKITSSVEERDDFDASAANDIDEAVARYDQFAKGQPGIEALGDPAAGFGESLQAFDSSKEGDGQPSRGLRRSAFHVRDYAV
jgi:hypothetical protein